MELSRIPLGLIRMHNKSVLTQRAPDWWESARFQAVSGFEFFLLANRINAHPFATNAHPLARFRRILCDPFGIP